MYTVIRLTERWHYVNGTHGEKVISHTTSGHVLIVSNKWNRELMCQFPMRLDYNSGAKNFSVTLEKGVI